MSADAPARRPRDRKRLILTTACELFVELGYPSVTMVMIAERLGITSGALYRHYDNKADILEAVMAENFAILQEPVVATDLNSLIESMSTFVRDHPSSADLWIHEARYLPETSYRQLEQVMRSWQSSLGELLRNEREDLDDGQAELLQHVLLSLVFCLTRGSMHAPLGVRQPAIRSAVRAATTAALVATGPLVDTTGSLQLPVSMRERLLLAAMEQFGYHGFYHATMNDIAATAGVTGSNLYGYFANKADILRAVIERANHALWLSLDDVLASGGGPEAQLRKVARSYIRRARTWSWTLDDPIGKAGLGEGFFKSSQREYVDEWVAFITRHQPGVKPRQARVRVQMCFSLISDMYRVPQVSSRSTFQDNLLSLVMAILLDGAV